VIKVCCVCHRAYRTKHRESHHCSKECYRNRDAKFWSRVAIGSVEECWEWTGARRPKGYGNASHENGPIEAHRLAWILTHGKPEGWVLHRCNNPPCCNPNHLYVGDAQDNANDRWNAGTMPFGMRNPNSRHTDKQIAIILAEYEALPQWGDRGRRGVGELEKKYGINRESIYRWRAGRRRAGSQSRT